MLYAVFMFWMMASISVVAPSMVLGGLLCVWCALSVVGASDGMSSPCECIVPLHYPLTAYRANGSGWVRPDGY